MMTCSLWSLLLGNRTPAVIRTALGVLGEKRSRTRSMNGFPLRRGGIDVNEPAFKERVRRFYDVLSPHFQVLWGDHLHDGLQRLVGMGCAGALPALQRANDYVRAYPDRRALLLAVEICSACWYIDDSLETVVGNAICADGAAAVLIGCDDHASGPRLEDFETLLEPALLESVGFQFRSGKLRIVLSKDIRKVAGGLVRRTVNKLLERNGVKFEELS